MERRDASHGELRDSTALDASAAPLSIEDAMKAEIPAITRTVLNELKSRLEADPALSPGYPVPFYRMMRNRFLRDLV